MKIDVSAIEDTKGASIEDDVFETIGRMSVGGREVTPAGPVEVRARATSTGHGRVLVQGRARARFEVACDRCLRPCVIEITSGLEQEYQKGREGKRPGQDPAQAGDAGGRVYFGDYVDITPEVRESLALCVPIRVVCNESCRGLCPRCGKNLNEGPCGCPNEAGDIRFETLRDLLRAEESES